MSSKNEDRDSCCTKRGLNSMPLFVFSASALFMFSRTGTIYLGGVIRTLERRFGLRSSQAGFLHSCDNITSMFVVLFIGYFGRWGHKPRIICITNLFTALSFFIMAIPYFVFDSTPVANVGLKAGSSHSGDHLQI
jgi:Organic Anion Transporter Polypeptide (OATP) family